MKNFPVCLFKAVVAALLVISSFGIAEAQPGNPDIPENPPTPDGPPVPLTGIEWLLLTGAGYGAYRLVPKRRK